MYINIYSFLIVYIIVIAPYIVAKVLCTMFVAILRRPQRWSKLPPGILQLGPKPHLSLAKLSREYGPLMSLQLGCRTTIVVSSPEIAKMVLQQYDIKFSSRPIPSSVKYIEHDRFSVFWLPVDNQWRMLKRMLKTELLSAPKLDASRGVRRAKMLNLYDYVRGCSEVGRAVDIGDAAFTTTLNLMSASLFSRELAHFDSSHEMKRTMLDLMMGAGKPNVADFFPVLERVDPQGISKLQKMQADKVLEIFDCIIEEKVMQSRRGTNDFVDVLLGMEGTRMSRDDIKHLLLDLFIAGTVTTANTVEWAMAELIRSPEKMSRLRDEIRGHVEEGDIENFPYLQAVVQETMRLHPAAPFLMPHKADSDVEIKGYLVPENAQVLINVWAIGRDPDVWTEAQAFMPERFLNVEKGPRDFKLIPFGVGSRSCPGSSLAQRMVHPMVATLVGHFGWNVQQIDMEEEFGLTLQKANPLKAVPIFLTAQ